MNTATETGSSGSGGEYGEQIGFGWTNGVVLSFLEEYGMEINSSFGVEISAWLVFLIGLNWMC